MKRIKQIHGFTLLEMLTAMAIIAVMIGLLIPAVGKIQTMALVVKQQAQFNAIGVGLEAFRSDSGRNDYPESSCTKLDGTVITAAGSSNQDGYSGAQKLAEALVGWDGFGFHPRSEWRSDGKADFDGDGNVELIYDVVNGVGSSGSLQTPAENLACRKGPYLELEKANAVKLSAVYTSSSLFALDTYVLADMFRTVKNRATGRRTGMPILYFRADTSKMWSTSNAQGVPTVMSNCIYNCGDNLYACVWAKAPWDITQNHPMRVDSGIFYQRIRNPNFPGTAGDPVNFSDARPYRADSIILLSAGPDGLYGTADDVYNIDENE